MSSFVTEDILWGTKQQRDVCVLWRTSSLRGGGRGGAGSETSQMCGGGSQRGAATSGSCSAASPAASWLNQVQTGGTRTALQSGVSEKGSDACPSKWGFVSFVLFLAPAWGAAPTWESIPRHFGSKVLVALIFISLGPFEPHCPPNKVKNWCGLEDRCISRGRKVNLNISGMKQKLLLDFVCIVLIRLSSLWLLEFHESY